MGSARRGYAGGDQTRDDRRRLECAVGTGQIVRKAHIDRAEGARPGE